MCNYDYIMIHETITVSVQGGKAPTAGLPCHSQRMVWILHCVSLWAPQLSSWRVHVCMCVSLPVCLWRSLAYSCLSLCSICRCRLSALLAKSNLKRLVPSSAELRCLSASCNLHHYNQGQTQDHGEKKLGDGGRGRKEQGKMGRRMAGKKGSWGLSGWEHEGGLAEDKGIRLGWRMVGWVKLKGVQWELDCGVQNSQENKGVMSENKDAWWNNEGKLP